jgi:hypothetical protein
LTVASPRYEIFANLPYNVSNDHKIRNEPLANATIMKKTFALPSETLLLQSICNCHADPLKIEPNSSRPMNKLEEPMLNSTFWNLIPSCLSCFEDQPVSLPVLNAANE